LLLSGFSGNSISFLNLSDDLLPFAVDYVQIIVGELAPPFFGLPFLLFPFSFDLIPVHIGLPAHVRKPSNLEWNCKPDCYASTIRRQHAGEKSNTVEPLLPTEDSRRPKWES